MDRDPLRAPGEAVVSWALLRNRAASIALAVAALAVVLFGAVWKIKARVDRRLLEKTEGKIDESEQKAHKEAFGVAESMAKAGAARKAAEAIIKRIRDRDQNSIADAVDRFNRRLRDEQPSGSPDSPD